MDYGRARVRASVVGAVVTPLCFGANAVAFPEDEGFIECGTFNGLWKFSSSSQWTEERKAAVRSAALAISNLKDFDGATLAPMAENSSAAFIVGLTTSTDAGVTNCDYTLLGVKSGSISYLKWLARHELMHRVGARHSGEFDSRDANNPPTMVTCAGTQDQMTRDDKANLAFLKSGLPGRQLSANIGFEDNGEDWSASGSATTSWHTSVTTVGTDWQFTSSGYGNPPGPMDGYDLQARIYGMSVDNTQGGAIRELRLDNIRLESTSP